MYLFDTSNILEVTDISKTELDYDSDWYDSYDEGLVVSLRMIPLKKRILVTITSI